MFPMVEPFDSGLLDVGDSQQIYAGAVKRQALGARNFVRYGVD
jgi:hypothetical protein